MGTRPVAIAGVAQDLTIDTVISMSDGRAYDARELLEQEDFRVVRLRNAIVDATSAHLEGSETGDATYRCATCGEPVRILGTMHSRILYYFQHAKRGVNCPLTIARLSNDEINARRFHGQTEGERHKRIKRLLYASLQADAAFNDLAVERYWAPSADDGHGKRPDVQATRGATRYAFEAQLSSTSAMVISARNRFYRSEGAVVTWFTDHVPDVEWRMYLKDLADVHRGNVFVVDEKTAVASMKAGRFLLRCHYTEPAWVDGKLSAKPLEKLVGFDELQVADGLTYFHDSTAALERAACDGEKVSPFRVLPRGPLPRPPVWSAADELLERLNPTHPRALLLDLLAEEPRRTGGRGARVLERFRLAKAALQGYGALLPDMRSAEFFSAERRFAGLFSAELGKPLGFAFPTLVQVAHQIESGHRRGTTAFLHVARHFGTEAVLEAHDKHGHWRDKVAKMREAVKYRESAPTVWAPYEPEPWWRELLAAIYPEIAAFSAGRR
jgi:DNA-directed RNA polymerase subunit RPC12/RpoP